MNNENIRNRRDFNEEIDVLEVLRFVLNKWIIVLLVGALGAVLSGLYTKYFIVPQYSSSSLVYIRGTSTTISSVNDIQIGYYLSDDYAIIFKSRTVMENVIEDLNITNRSANGISNLVTVSNQGRNILKVSATTSDPNLSRDIVNSVVKHSIDIVKEINTKEPFIIEKAIANPNKVSPSMSKNVALGALGGIGAATVFFAMIYLINDKVNGVEMVETKLGLPVIGKIPTSESLIYNKRDKKKKKKEKRIIRTDKPKMEIKETEDMNKELTENKEKKEETL